MRTKLYLFAGLLFLITAVISCKKNDDPNPPQTENVFWEDHWRVCELKGQPKTVVFTDGEYDWSLEFNSNGKLIKQHNTILEYDSKNRLTKIIRGEGDGSYCDCDIIELEYGNHSKYVMIQHLFDFPFMLVKGVTAIILDGIRCEFIVNKTSITFVDLFDEGDFGYTMYYSGDFPTHGECMIDGPGQIAYKYGKDYKFSEVYQTYDDSEHYGKSIFNTTDTPYILPTFDERILDELGYNTTKYEYTSDWELIKKIGTGLEYHNYEESYSNYKYDSQGNWTERTINRKYGSGETKTRTETRTITYYN